jgi:hypothetical protein
MKDVGNRIKWFVGAAGAVVLLQLVPVDRANPPIDLEMPAPVEVQAVLERSCYDCHSNETSWPWYGYVAPVSWLLARDVNDARAELNFSTWNVYRPDKRVRLLRDVLEEVDDKTMPPSEYLWMHSAARVSTEELEILRTWIEAQDR